MTEPSRRERALAVARDLAEAGGWETVTMRTVAERSGSALATLYREFPSKTHLVVALAEQEIATVRPPRADHVRTHGSIAAVTGVLQGMTSASLDRPRFTAAVLQGILTAGPDAAEPVERLRGQLADLLYAGLDDPHPDDPRRIELLLDVWFGQLLATVHERQTADSCIELLRTAVPLVLGR